MTDLTPEQLGGTVPDRTYHRPPRRRARRVIAAWWDSLRPPRRINLYACACGDTLTTTAGKRLTCCDGLDLP